MRPTLGPGPTRRGVTRRRRPPWPGHHPLEERGGWPLNRSRRRGRWRPPAPRRWPSTRGDHRARGEARVEERAPLGHRVRRAPLALGQVGDDQLAVAAAEGRHALERAPEDAVMDRLDGVDRADDAQDLLAADERHELVVEARAALLDGREVERRDPGDAGQLPETEFEVGIAGWSRIVAICGKVAPKSGSGC